MNVLKLGVLILLSITVFTGCKTMANIPEDMVYVPPGKFIKGTDDSDMEGLSDEFGLPVALYEDEQPRHKVFLEGYFIDKYEVTNGQYKEFLQLTGHRAPASWSGINGMDNFLQHPVTYVSWYDADDYCRWLGKQLPSENQWEKAARGANGNKYSWGSKFNADMANIYLSAKSAQAAMPVGSFPEGRSVYGAEDMIGNVWEWTADWYGRYPGNEVNKKEYGRVYKSTRGQSFMRVGHFSDEEGLQLISILSRASSRFYDYPTAAMPDLGFRCAQKPR